MPTARAPDGTQVGYGLDAERTDRPPVVLVGDCGLGAWQWAWQHPAVAGPRPVVTAEYRGGTRADPPTGPCDLQTLADDVRAVVEAAGVGRPHLVGAGLGGLVALSLALAGEARSLALVGTGATGNGVDPSPLFADPADEDAVRTAVRAGLSESFCDRHPEVVDRVAGWRREEDPTPTEAAWQAAALEADLSDRLVEIRVPALVVHGDADPVWPVAGAARLAEGLPRGDLRRTAGAGHLVGCEAAAPVNDALVGFLDRVDDA